MSRIVELNIRNFMGVEAVQIEPDGHLVILKGANGSSKTSILTAIWAMLASKAGLKDIDKPVRDGATTAVIEGVIDLGDGEGLRITRTFSANDGMKIKVTTLDGSMAIRSPETALKKLFTSISFDPLAFSKMKPKEQVEVYLRAVDTEIDLDELNVKRSGIFDQRTEVNREADTIAKTLAGLPESTASDEDEEVSAASILAEQQAAQQRVTINRQAREYLLECGEGLVSAQLRVEQIRSALKQAETDLEDATMKLGDAESGEIGEDPDMTVFAERIEKVEATNREIRLAKQRAAYEVARLEAMDRAVALSAQLDKIDTQKRAIIEAVPQIVEGLTFNEDGMFFNGTPLAQASGSERLLVSCRVGMALNPGLKVMTLQDGPLLDAESMKLLETIAEENDAQVWVERQLGTDADGVGFTIAEGSVIGRPERVVESRVHGKSTAEFPLSAVDAAMDEADGDVYGDDDEAAVDAFMAVLGIDENYDEVHIDTDEPSDDAPPIWEDPDAGY